MAKSNNDFLDLIIKQRSQKKHKKFKVKKAIQLLGEDLCDSIEERARLFEEKWT